MRSIKIFILFILFGFAFLSIKAQNRYWIFFKDKKDVEFNPYEYFDSHTIERRLKQGIPLASVSDFPLNSEYIDSLSTCVQHLGKQTRWFNAIAVSASNAQIDQIRKFEFVKDIQPIVFQTIVTDEPVVNTLSESNQFILEHQTKRMQGDLFMDDNIDGSGIRIAIFDGGFEAVDIHPAFNHLYENNQILKTWDFVRNREHVYGYISHGTMVLSCIAGIHDSVKVGLATGAEFLLARTEVSGEPFSEEENWLAAAEWADKNGADIINSSLGYTYHRYFPDEMDGKTSLVVKAANMAASKGILVVNSQGNAGNNRWKYGGTPGDGDSVLAVGGISPFTNYHASFSSYGPTSDKRLKPNVVAFGYVIAARKRRMLRVTGTSFASPLVAGFAACAWQKHPDYTNMQLFEEICKSADLYPYFDYAHGYGVPQASYFLEASSTVKDPSFEFENNTDSVFVLVHDKYLNDSAQYQDYLFYHIQNKQGYLDKYAVLEVSKKKVLAIPANKLMNENILKVHFKGYTATFGTKK
jgi:subtilisin family serine protease